MKKHAKMTLAVIALGAAMFATPARADTIRFCVHINAEYSDSCRGFGAYRDPATPGECVAGSQTEDLWASRYFVRDWGAGDYPQPLSNEADKARFQAFRGGHIKIVEGSSESGKELFNGYVDDGSNSAVGCTGWLTPDTAAGNYWIRIWSEGKIRNFHYKAVDNNYNGPAGPNCPNGDGHRLSSIEYNSTALSEGFAHAYATKVWNDPSEPDAVFPSYSGGIVDMDNGDNGNCPERVMETRCTDAGASAEGFAGKGNEVDWARAFWELHACDPAGDTTLDKIGVVLDSANAWGIDNAYANVNAAMNSSSLPALMRNC